jgi:predicted aspartyl protease
LNPDGLEIEAILSVGTWDTELTLFPDTGFDGGVAIPAGAAREVLASPDDDRMQVADGRIVAVPRWDGSIEIEGHRFRCEVIALGNNFLLGREVLDQMEICFVFGKKVRLRFE